MIGVTEAFKADKDPRKINLGVGAYRDEHGKPYVLNAVKRVGSGYIHIWKPNLTLKLQAEYLLTAASPDKEYLPITGLPEFTKNAAKLAYGPESVPLKQNAVGLCFFFQMH